jgi:hypothetical protein
MNSKRYIESYGYLKFDPNPAHNKNKKVSHKLKGDNWCMLIVPSTIDLYYQWFIEKRYNLKLNRSPWGPHISIVRAHLESHLIDKSVWKKVKTKWQDRKIKFVYDSFPKTSGKHWWLTCFMSEAYSIREDLGLIPKPKQRIHLTIGRPYQQHEDHSKYIKRLLDKGIAPEHEKIE